MSWVKLDDQWMDHPKIVRAGRDARDMWLASITWCSKHLTDGYFPKELLPSLAVMAGVDVANCQTFANTLLHVCLWEMHDDQYYIHDYLDYNPTKEQANATKAARSAAGRAGGNAKASKTASKTVANSWQNSAPSPSPSRLNNGGGGGEKPALNVFAIYEQEIGPITEVISEVLKDAEDEHKPQWVIAAIKIASMNGKRSWSYVNAILKRWKTEGYGSEMKPKPGGKNGKAGGEPAGFAGIREFLAQQGESL